MSGRMGGGGGRAGWASNDDLAFLSLLVLTVALGVYGYIAWTYYHASISRAFAFVAHWHILVIQTFTPEYDGLDHQLLTAYYPRVTLKGIGAAANAIGVFFRIPAAVLLGSLAALCFWRAAPARYTHRLDMDALIREHARSFRSTAAFARRKLRLTPFSKDGRVVRPADPALHPAEWMVRVVGGVASSDAEIRAALVQQLGAPWRGSARAEPHVRVMFTVFALHMAQRRREAAELLGTMAEALAPARGEADTGPDQPLALPASVSDRLPAYLVGDVVKEAEAAAARHAFTAPALMTLLTEARRRAGVLAPASFNGLKLVDRSLWYALHSLGFPTDTARTNHPNPCIEAIGARDHWALELALGRPVGTPSLDRALAAIRAACPVPKPAATNPSAQSDITNAEANSKPAAPQAARSTP